LEDEERLTDDIIDLARLYGRYGYRKIAEFLRRAGWVVNDKRVERIWQREGLKVPARQPKRGRLWLTDGSCIRLRAAYRNHVWSYDFVEDRTHDGRKYRMLNIVDEYTHECLTIRIPDGSRRWMFTRFATMPLLGMVFVIQTFVYPENWVEHLTWATMLIFILTRGPGSVSLDRLLKPILFGRGEH